MQLSVKVRVQSSVNTQACVHRLSGTGGVVQWLSACPKFTKPWVSSQVVVGVKSSHICAHFPPCGAISYCTELMGLRTRKKPTHIWCRHSFSAQGIEPGHEDTGAPCSGSGGREVKSSGTDTCYETLKGEEPVTEAARSPLVNAESSKYTEVDAHLMAAPGYGGEG